MNMSNVTDDMPVSEYLVAKAFDKISSYTVYEYFTSKGDAYIDTGFKPNSNTRVETDLIDAQTNPAQWFFGTRDGVNKNAFGFMTASNEYRTDYGNTTRYIETTGLYESFTVDKNKNYTKLKSHKYSQHSIEIYNSEQTFSCAYTMYIFGMNQGGSSSSFSLDASIGYFRIYDNGVLVRDMVPVIDNATGEYGYYDKVNSTFHPKLGNGTFTANSVVGTIDTSENYSKEKIASCKTVANVLGIEPTHSGLDLRPVSTGLVKAYYNSIPKILNLATASWKEIHEETLKINYTNYETYQKNYEDQIGTKRIVEMESEDITFILVGICLDYDKLYQTPIEERAIAFTSWVSEPTVGYAALSWREIITYPERLYFSDLSSDLSPYIMGVTKSNNRHRVWTTYKLWVPSVFEYGLNLNDSERYDDGNSYPYYNSADRRSSKNYQWTRSYCRQQIGQQDAYMINPDGTSRTDYIESNGFCRAGFCV